MNDPIHYARAELRADAIARLDNRARYIAQSAATKAGQRAELTPREKLRAIRYEREQSPSPVIPFTQRRGV